MADPAIAARFARSVARVDRPAAQTLAWLDARARANHFQVRRIPWHELREWELEPATGNLCRRGGRFFTIEGLRVDVDGGRRWHQPVVVQPESGIVGILAQERDGVLRFLLQAKMEPGNRNVLQLSPTVQATQSNYKKAHQGASVRYLDHFARAAPADVLVDVLQSEPGAWFYRKTNRNMIVEATGPVEVLDDFIWLTLGEIGELLWYENAVNMNTRSALACAPLPAGAADGRPGAGAPEPDQRCDLALRSWFTGVRARRALSRERVPLATLPGWVRDEWSIAPAAAGAFRVVAVSTEAGNREVTSWSQPIVEPIGWGLNAFLCTDIGGRRHVLVQAAVEAGLADDVELAPTVQVTPDSPPDTPFLDLVRGAEPARMRFHATLSEEGGRLLGAQNRYLIVETDLVEAPPDYRWVTPGQLRDLAQHSHYVNSQARTLLACLVAAVNR